MKVKRTVTAMAATVALAAGSAVAAAPAASAHGHGHGHGKDLGETSLAEVLLADGDEFDGNWHDYDIVTQAVLAVLDGDNKSPVSVLTDGTQPLTAFIPNDRAFRKLVKDLSGTRLGSESEVFDAVAGSGIDLETVLLYHVVPGATITAEDAKQSDGAVLTTAQTGTIEVKVRDRHWHDQRIKLIDNDPDARNPRVIDFDINEGNKQIAHGINRVLRPLDL